MFLDQQRMKKILISCGQIPGKVDSINYLGNGSNGHWAFSMATMFMIGNEITILKWTKTKISGAIRFSSSIHIIDVDDVHAYYDYIDTHQFDVYMLAAEVPKLIPAMSMEKSPLPIMELLSGMKNPGISIPYVPSPRAIDIVKKNWPKATLIGFKLFNDSISENEFINDGFKILYDAHATAIISFDPGEEREKKKTILLPDASIQRLEWMDSINFIRRIINLRRYKTEVYSMSPVEDRIKKELQNLLDQIKETKYGYTFGTVSLKDGGNIIATTRGKRGSYWGKNMDVDNSTFTLKGDEMTPNIPMLNLLYNMTPGYPIILHGHRMLPNVKTLPYYFDGTTETIENYKLVERGDRFINIETHGYYAMFESVYKAQEWLTKQ